MRYALGFIWLAGCLAGWPVIFPGGFASGWPTRAFSLDRPAEADSGGAPSGAHAWPEALAIYQSAYDADSRDDWPEAAALYRSAARMAIRQIAADPKLDPPAMRLYALAMAGQAGALASAGRFDEAAAACQRFLDRTAAPPLASGISWGSAWGPAWGSAWETELEGITRTTRTTEGSTERAAEGTAEETWTAIRMAFIAQQASCYHRLGQMANMEHAWLAYVEAYALQFPDAAPGEGKYPGLDTSLAEAFYRLGERTADRLAHTEAAARYGLAAAWWRSSPYARAARHRQALSLGQAADVEGAVDAYTRLLSDFPGASISNRELRWLAGWLYENGRDADAWSLTERWLAAIDAAGSASAGSPEPFRIRLRQAHMRRRSGQHRRAAALFAEIADAVQAAPDAPNTDGLLFQARLGQAMSLREAGQPAQARPVLRLLAEQSPPGDPRQSLVWREMGLLARAEGHAAEAHAWLARADFME